MPSLRESIPLGSYGLAEKTRQHVDDPDASATSCLCRHPNT